ncbi:MAG TPA: molybdopterin-dependent oxidoreductase, partial [Pseudomonadales bacterium]|nr:molybdopterin-dependent oxidoreductase [Pseudomonadales bacterium]
MLIRIRSKSEVLSSEITPEGAYFNRRSLLKAMSAAALWPGIPAALAWASETTLYPVEPEATATPSWLRQKIAERKVESKGIGETLTPYKDVTHYNNFYEFGMEKSDPAEYENKFKSYPWSVEIAGAVKNPGIYQLEDFVKPYQLEDRIYRFRCVEAWSMVVPWLGFPLQDLIKKVEPESKAKYVAFTTLQD